MTICLFVCLQTRLAFIQMCGSIFKHTDHIISHCYIREFTATLCSHVSSAANNEQIEKDEVMQSIATLELLINLASKEHSKYRHTKTALSVETLMLQKELLPKL